MAVALEEKEVQRVTCRLVDNIVETCGEEWRQCHDQEDVRRMKDMHVESLLSKNRGAVVDIEQCDTIKQFRSRQTVYHDDDSESCSDEKFVKAQTDFQTCTHSVTSSVNDDIQNLSSLKSISILLCKAISNISNNCVDHLKKCLDAEDVITMSENHLEQLKVYFVKLAGDKVDTDFSLDNCLEASGDIIENTINSLEKKFSDEVDQIKETIDSNELKYSKDIENDYVMDEQKYISGSDVDSIQDAKYKLIYEVDKLEEPIQNRVIKESKDIDTDYEKQQDNTNTVKDNRKQENYKYGSQKIVDTTNELSNSTSIHTNFVFLLILIYSVLSH